MQIIPGAAVLIAAILSATPAAVAQAAGEIPGMVKSSWGIDDTPLGVYCAVNQVRLLAQTADDCHKAGGTVTHSLATTATPVDQ